MTSNGALPIRTKPPRSRASALFIAGAVFLLASTALRAALAFVAWREIRGEPAAVALAFAAGAFYDLVAFVWAAAPFALCLAIVPDRIARTLPSRVLGFTVFVLFVYVVWFDVAAEWLFWDEFDARFNFIAVDYLVYTREVVENIRESYRLWAILAGLLVPTVAVAAFLRRSMLDAIGAPARGGERLALAVAAVVLPAFAFVRVDDRWVQFSDDRFVRELARSGPYSLFAAFRSNDIEYSDFYATIPEHRALTRLRDLVLLDDAVTADGPATGDLTRDVASPRPARRSNVVLVVEESLSARFLEAFGGDPAATPVLNDLLPKSLRFTDCYATGIRTVRGLEAVALSLPPTPGQSVLKRPHHENLFNVGGVLAGRGYDVKFVYGGAGLFDDMGPFFSSNGFRVVDRSDFAPDEVHFENAWGVCDEDLFARVIREGDRSHERGAPFFSLVMTTSNHRPFTYPGGRIDIESGHGRSGAVKYADFAIGRLLSEAATRPWFDDTLFVIVADHCESARGRTELPVDRFHIPWIVFAPKLVPPRAVPGVCSQIDVAPTVLGLLGGRYRSRFFGQDVLAHVPGRALLCNYLHVGLFTGDRLVTLGPHQDVEISAIDSDATATRLDGDATRPEAIDAIAWFQGTSWMLAHRANAALP